jgi:hypothetical protein
MTIARRLLSARLVLDIGPPGALADATDGRGIDGAQRSIARLPGRRRRTRQAADARINVGFLGQLFRIPYRAPDTAKMFRLRRPTMTLD